jgi:hypothetical protein
VNNAIQKKIGKTTRDDFTNKALPFQKALGFVDRPGFSLVF